MSEIVIIWLAYVPLALWRGLVVAALWGWYVEPFGLPALTVVQAVGLGILASLFNPHSPSKEDEERGALWFVAYQMLFAALALALGWAWSFFL